MKLSILLSENFLRDYTEDEESKIKEMLIDTLKKNCKQYLKDNLADLIDEEYFARNMAVEHMFGIKETRPERIRRDTKEGFSQPLEKYFVDTFGKNYRTNNVLFTYRSKSDMLSEYSESLVLIIPIDGTKMVSSEEISDFYVTVQHPVLRNVLGFVKKMDCKEILTKCLGSKLVKKVFDDMAAHSTETDLGLLTTIYLDLFVAGTGSFKKGPLIDSLEEERFSFNDETLPHQIADAVEDKVDYLMTEIIKSMDYKELPAKPTEVSRDCECMIDTKKYFYFVINEKSTAFHDDDRYNFFLECVKEAIKD
jgi:hypothetical protein